MVNPCELILKLLAPIDEWHENLSEYTALDRSQCTDVTSRTQTHINVHTTIFVQMD